MSILQGSPTRLHGFEGSFFVCMNSEKESIRKIILEKRLSLLPEEISRLSEMIQSRILKTALWKKCERLGLYHSTKNEVETNLLFMKALEAGSSVYFPRVEQGIQFYEVNEPSDLEKGAWGILEPKHSCTPLPKIEKLDLLIVPGLAFDKTCHRLGYGRGFYDVVLEAYATCSIGVAYDFQIVEKLPVDPWDRHVKQVMTEKNEY